MSDESNQVSISIFGQEYSVKAPADPEYIIKIGEYLDGKMREVQAGFTTTQSSTRIAILAAMNITDELFSSRQLSGTEDSEVEEKISTLIELIEETI